MNLYRAALLALLSFVGRVMAAPDTPVPWTQARIDAVVRVQVSYPGYSKPSVSTGFISASPGRYYVVMATHALANVHPANGDYVPPGTAGASEECVPIEGATITLTRGEGSLETLIHDNCVIHRGWDVSLVPIVARQGGYPSLRMVARKLRKYDRVYVAGYANGYSSLDTVGNGLVSQFTDPPDELAVAHLATTQGMSGGPYLASDGAVVGFHRGGLPYNQDFAHFTRVEKVRPDLEPVVGPIEIDVSEHAPSPSLAEFAVGQARVGSLFTLAHIRRPSDRFDAWEAFQARTITKDERKVLSRLTYEAITASADPTPALMQAASVGDRVSLARYILEGASEKMASCWSEDVQIAGGLLACDGKSMFLKGAREGSPINPTLIVLHSTESYGLSAAIEILANPSSSSGASVHFVIDRDGAIVQLVRTTSAASHARGEWHGVQDINQHSIGVEFVNAGRLIRREDGRFARGSNIVPENEVIAINKDGVVTYWHRYTAAQLRSAEALVKALVAAHSINDVVGHCNVSPARVDPGPAFPLQGFVETTFGQTVPSCQPQSR